MHAPAASLDEQLELLGSSAKPRVRRSRNDEGGVQQLQMQQRPLLQQEATAGIERGVDSDLSTRDKEEEDAGPRTQWKAIFDCGLVYFLIFSVLQALTVLAMSYLRQLDESVPPIYSGYHLAVVKIGHAVGTIGFALYAYRTKNFKITMLIGRAISLAALVLYLLLLAFPVELRRYAFLAAFFAQSLAEGSLIVIRSFVARVSSRADRQSAFGVINAAVMMSILAGPGIQAAVMLLPKAQFSDGFYLDYASYGAIACLLLSGGAAALVAARMEEPPETPEETSEKEGTFGAQLAVAMEQVSKMDRTALAMVFFEKVVTSCLFSALLGSFNTLMVNRLNMVASEADSFMAVSQVALGLVSILTVAAFVLTRLSKLRSSLILFFSLACYFSLYLYSYPWSPLSEPIVTINQSMYGCNTTVLPWCETQEHVKLWYWVPAVVVLFGMAVPSSFVAMDTVYSKLLGDIDQNLMQGAFSLVEDLTCSVAPLITMHVYQQHGPAAVWLILAGTAAVGFVAWLPLVPRMRRLAM